MGEFLTGVEHAGTPVQVWLHQPNTKRWIDLEYNLRTDLVRSESDREDRLLGPSLRISQKSVHVLTGASAADFRKALATLGDKRVAVPLWVDCRPVAQYSTRVHTARYWWDFEEGEIVPDVFVPGLSPEKVVAPLLFGRLKERPEAKAENRVLGEYEFQIDEDGPWDWRCGVHGIDSPGQEFPALAPAWTRVSDLSGDRIELSDVGQSRERAVSGSEAPARWGQEAAFVLPDRGSIRTLLTHFALTSHGRHASFVVPAWFRPHTASTPETPSAYVARYGADQMRLRFRNQVLAETTIKLWQVPWELNPPEGEIFAQERAIAYLYRFEYLVPPHSGGPVLHQYTSWERALQINVGSGSDEWEPAKIEHSDVRFDLRGTDSLTLMTRFQDANPVQLIWMGRDEAPVIVRIFEVDPLQTNGPRLREVFAGEVGEVSQDGEQLKAKVGDPAGRRVPRLLVQRLDNHPVFAPESGVNRESYARTAKVLDSWFGGRKLLLEWTDEGPHQDDDWFSGGWVEHGVGASWRFRAIAKHYREPDESSDLHVDLERPLEGVEAGDMVTLLPGYDGRWETAQSKFALGSAHYNFAGMPHVPLVDPNTVGEDVKAPAKK